MIGRRHVSSLDLLQRVQPCRRILLCYLKAELFERQAARFASVVMAVETALGHQRSQIIGVRDAQRQREY